MGTTAISTIAQIIPALLIAVFLAGHRTMGRDVRWPRFELFATCFSLLLGCAVELICIIHIMGDLTMNLIYSTITSYGTGLLLGMTTLTGFRLVLAEYAENRKAAQHNTRQQSKKTGQSNQSNKRRSKKRK